MTGGKAFERIDTDWPYNLTSPGIRVGDFLYVSGQISVDEDGRVIGAGDFDVQAEQVFRNLGRVLEAGGSSFRDVFRTTVYLTDVRNRPKVLELRERYFTPPYPASSLVGVKELAWPELLVEVEAISWCGR